MIHPRGLNKYAVFALLAIPLILVLAFFGKSMVKKVSAGWAELNSSGASIEAAH